MNQKELNKMESIIKERRKNLVARELYGALKLDFDRLNYPKDARIAFCEQVSQTFKGTDQSMLDSIRFILSTHKRREE